MTIESLRELPPTRLHWTSVVRDVPLRQLVQNLLAPVVAGFGVLGPAAATRVMVALAVLFVLYRVVAWRHRTLSLRDGLLTDRRGVLARKERQIAVARLQQVELERGPVDRALGIARVRMEAAADAGSTEIDLRAVPLDLARRLAGLRDAGDVAGDDLAGDDLAGDTSPAEDGHATAVGVAVAQDAAPPPGELLYAPSLRRVAIASATGRRLGALPLAIFAGFQLVDELQIDVEGLVGEPSLRAGGATVVALVVGAVVLGVALTLAAAVVLGLLRDGNVEVRRDGDVVHVRRGLLTVRRASFPLRRVQAVAATANVLQRRLGFRVVELRTSANPGLAVAGDAERRVTLPHVEVADLDGLLAEMVPSLADLPVMRPHPDRARGRHLRRVLLLTLVLAAPVAVIAGGFAGSWALGGGLVVAAAVFGAWAGRRSFEQLAHGADDRLVATSSGLWGTRQTRVPVARVQSAWTSSQPLQRRVDLVTLHVTPAGARPAISSTDLDAGEARRLAAALTAAAPSPAATTSAH